MTESRVHINPVLKPDRPLYRIFQYPRFIQALDEKELALVTPGIWPDPDEDPMAKVVLEHDVAGRTKQHPLSEYLSPCWAQCWSDAADSDVLLRAYSILNSDAEGPERTENEGVRVKTTVRSLTEVMTTWAEAMPEHHFYLGQVLYDAPTAFPQSLINRLSGPAAHHCFSSPHGRADSMLTKRSIFKHEEEVRILAIESYCARRGAQSTEIEI
ncbi:hypothetical protein [Mesorhizobium mediterraneum]|uniref:hypothetical protein n=1 Tax=Mesorhizobium mediterraneum TaxID=43617 RepID=UPI00177D259C|nr:hypothetical protein [Mesorhizobium mediterraneum]